MIYQKIITTPRNRAKETPLVTPMPISKGLMFRIEVTFPSGAWGLHHVVIMDGGHQVAPVPSGEDFASDNTTIAFDDMYLKLAEPFMFWIVTWNEDECNEHRVEVRIGLVTKDIFMARFMPTVTWEHIKSLIAEDEEKDEEEKQGRLGRVFDWLSR